MGTQYIRVEPDAHAVALYHLDPVARRVLRRDQGEGRAGAAVESLDDSVERDLFAIEIGVELDALAWAHLRQLNFLEIGVHVHLADRNDVQERGGRLDALPELHLASGDHAVDR